MKYKENVDLINNNKNIVLSHVFSRFGGSETDLKVQLINQETAGAGNYGILRMTIGDFYTSSSTATLEIVRLGPDEISDLIATLSEIKDIMLAENIKKVNQE